MATNSDSYKPLETEHIYENHYMHAQVDHYPAVEKPLPICFLAEYT